MASRRKRPVTGVRIIEPPPVEDTRGATPERLVKARGAVDIGRDERGAATLTTMRDSPIERALARGVISERQHTAAVKFYNHWYRAGLSAPLHAIELDRIFASDGSYGTGMARTEAQAFHRDRYREAVSYLRARLGGVHHAVLESVICDEQPFENVGAKMLWKSTPKGIAAVTVMVRDGLDELVRLWGI